jgi:hypothetical protein
MITRFLYLGHSVTLLFVFPHLVSKRYVLFFLPSKA